VGFWKTMPTRLLSFMRSSPFQKVLSVKQYLALVAVAGTGRASC
jgi:hypothetical protein